MKNRKVLTIDEQISELVKKSKFQLITYACIITVMAITSIILWLSVGWQLAFYILVIGIPIYSFLIIATIRHTKQDVERLRAIQKESQLLSCEDEYEKEGNVNN